MINHLHYESINAVAARWADNIWAVSWQFCVLGLVVLVAHWSLRRAAPHWRYWLWQILAIKLLLMPFWTATAPWKWPSSSKTKELIADSRPREGLATAKSASTPQASESGNGTSPDAASKLIQTQGPNDVSPLAVTQGAGRKTISSPSNRSNPTSRPKEAGKSQPQDVAGQSALTASPASDPPIDRKPMIASVPSEQSQGLAITPPGNSATAPISSESRKPLNTEPIPTPGLSWQAWLMLGWAVGVAWFGGRIVWQGVALSRRLRESKPAEPAVIQRVREAAGRLGMSRIPDVSVIDLDVSPFVCGLWRTRLILPRGLTESFTAEQLDLVLLHELAHVRRRDLVWGWIPEVARVLFFFHPMVHFLCYQIRFERELACDQLAMSSSGRDVATYADTLVRVVGQFSCPDSFRMAAAENPQT